MQQIILYGEDFEKEKAIIENSINEDPIYILDSKEHEPGAYLEFLHDFFRLKNRIIMRMRICQELKFKDQVLLYKENSEGELTESKPASLSELLAEMGPEEKCRIIIVNDDRGILADITQQLAYINYPLENVEIQLDREADDAVRTGMFIENLECLADSLHSAREALANTKITPNEPGSEALQKILDETRQLYSDISETLEKAYEVEMRIAVAASKKTGKSVLVNGILKQELAPSGRKLATPNCCVYRRSADENYHLHYNNGHLLFSSSNDLLKKIREEFNVAQYEENKHHTIANMEIEYVSRGGNFENYTIYDTPGHDAAGTGHDKVAKEAIKECDAAIFAIDFEKYLITSEVDYLNAIKAEFERKGKFHTLIFVLNKIDRLLSEKGAQSRVGIIDLIRNRLTEIDTQFSDCIIFPVSALDYSYTCELESRAENESTLLPLLEEDCDWYVELRKVKRELSENSEDEDLLALLSNLEAEATKIVDILGLKKINLRVMQQFSGMPQLLKYINYIMRGKAREEILNSLTIAINLQINRMKGILKDQENIRRLQEKMEHNAQQAEKIRSAIREYSKAANAILSQDLTERDYEALNGYSQIYGKNKVFLEELRKLIKSDQFSFPLSIDKMFIGQRREIASFSERDLQLGLWQNFILVVMEHIRRLEGQYVREEDLELNDEERKRIFERFALEELAKKSRRAREMIHETQKALSFLMDYRIYELKRSMELCRKAVEKEDLNLLFPQLPEFSVNFPAPEINPVNMEIKIADKISKVFESLNFIHQLFRNLSNDNPLDTIEYEVKALGGQKLEEKLRPLYADFCEELSKNKVYEKYQTHLFALANNMQVAQREILAKFAEINTVLCETVNNFAKLADDSQEFLNEFEINRRTLRLVNRIKDVSKDFLECWNAIVRENPIQESGDEAWDF